MALIALPLEHFQYIMTILRIAKGEILQTEHFSKNEQINSFSFLSNFEII